MAKKKSQGIEENVEILSNFDLPTGQSVNDLPDEKEEDKKPLPHEPEWQDYVLGQLWADEVILDSKGNKRPKASGLARVFEIVIGPITNAQAKVFESGPGRAVVEYTLCFRKELEGRGTQETICFQEVSEVNAENTQEPYINYAVPTAATVAEGRAYKKAMKLRIYTAEEIVPETELMSLSNKKADDSQVSVIHMLIQRCGIDKDKFLNKLDEHFKKGWKGFEDFTFEAAHKVIENLNKYVQKVKEVPDDILGSSSPNN